MAQSKINSEFVWVEYYGKDGKPTFAITSKLARDVYFVYDLTKTPPKKLGKARTPVELENKFIFA